MRERISVSAARRLWKRRRLRSTHQRKSAPQRKRLLPKKRSRLRIQRETFSAAKSSPPFSAVGTTGLSIPSFRVMKNSARAVRKGIDLNFPDCRTRTGNGMMPCPPSDFSGWRVRGGKRASRRAETTENSNRGKEAKTERKSKARSFSDGSAGSAIERACSRRNARARAVLRRRRNASRKRAKRVSPQSV